MTWFSFLHLLVIQTVCFSFSECENNGQCPVGNSDFSPNCKRSTREENHWFESNDEIKGDEGKFADISEMMGFTALFSGRSNSPKDGCKTPQGMIRLISNSKYFVRKDLGPVPDTKAPPNYRPVKEYCESLNLKLPTIQHHADYVSLQEYILTLAHANPERILTTPDGWKYTDRMVFLDVKYNECTDSWMSEQNPNASVYIIFDWSYPDNTVRKPTYGGREDTRLMVNAIRFYQKWNKTDDENDDKNKYWMAVSSGNQRVKNKFHPLVLCQFPEESECHLKSHEEKQNQIEIKAAEGRHKDLDILGWINGHLIAVTRNPVSRKDAVDICENEGMEIFRFEFFRNTGNPTSISRIKHPALNVTNQKYLRAFRDYYVCRNLKNRIMPLAPFWAIEEVPDEPSLQLSISLSDYNPDEEFRVKYRFYTHRTWDAGSSQQMGGFYSFCYCAETNCTVTFPKDKNSCSV